MNVNNNNEEVFNPSMEMHGLKESEPSLRVRDMINLYNFATEKNQALSHAKSLYFSDSNAELDQPVLNQTLLEEERCTLQHAEDCTSCKQKHDSCNCSSAMGGNQAKAPSELPTANAEKSYQSQTTIRRTAQGVRIIIDIYFDKKNENLNFVGSRVETDIPESRILADFQQQSLSMSESTEI